MSEATPAVPVASAAPASESPASVRLASFQGPLDLLLHLIRTAQIDVTTLQVAEIARQYNEWLAASRAIDPGPAGEHVVGVATLIHMKSRSLLPPDPALPAETPEAAGEQDAIDRAARREALRGAAEHLEERESFMELVYFRPPSAVADYASEQGIDADLFALLRAFREILGRLGADEAAQIRRERITLVERIHWLLETLQRERRIHFRALFADVGDRVACILTFLALLEVIRLRLARAYTSHDRGDILVIHAEEPAPEGPGPVAGHA